MGCAPRRYMLVLLSGIAAACSNGAEGLDRPSNGASDPGPTEDPVDDPVDDPIDSGMEPIDAPRSCPEQGWCWVQGPPLTVGASGDRVFSLGFRATLLIWSDTGWSVDTLPTETVLRSVLLDRPGDRWAADADGRTFHDDGSGWALVLGEDPITEVRRARDGSVWGLSRGRGGAHGLATETTLLRWDADRWRRVLPDSPYDYPGGLLAVSADEVWATGLVTVEGSVRHAVHRFRGESWEQVGPSVEGYAWPSELKEVEGRIRHPEMGEWDGERWREFEPDPVPEPAGTPEFREAAQELRCSPWLQIVTDAEQYWCASRGQVYFGDGTTWTPTLVDRFARSQPPARWGELPPSVWAGREASAAVGSAPDDVLRLRAGFVERSDGAAWQVVYEGESAVRSLAGTGRSDAWFVDVDGRLLRYDGRAAEPIPVPGAGAVGAVFALDDGSVVATTQTQVFIFDDGRWTPGMVVREGWAPSSVAGTSARDVYVVEEQGGRSNEIALHHFDGSTWQELPVDGLDAFARLTTHRGEVWMHSRDLVRELDGDTWISTPEVSFADLWVTNDAVWVFGHDRAARHPLP